ncbi:hypothetical protein Q1695_005591 [Nippostrongylus brasiliensis]|nr:hypothetical protein Q1695_005591 [Nippostrongylus brasiliensis]
MQPTTMNRLDIVRTTLSRASPKRLVLAAASFVAVCFAFIRISSSRVSSTAEYEWMCDCVVDGVHHDFCYRLPHNEQIRGKPFKCSNAVYVKRLGLLPTADLRAEDHNASAEAIFVTALSDNHFNEGLTLIANVRSLWPQRKIIAFNLGLKHDSVARLRSLCHVELRAFPFHDFPDHVRSLFQYRWKPLIIAMMLLEYDAVWYMDTSVRWKRDRLHFVHNQTRHCKEEKEGKSEEIRNSTAIPMKDATCKKSSILLNVNTNHGVFPTTHPDVYMFLPTSMERLLKTLEYGATMMYVVRTSESIGILKWLVLCALERNCMSPPGADIYCHFGSDKFSQYAHCHRFDQAVLNILLANAYDYDTKWYTSGLGDADVIIERSAAKSIKPESLLCNGKPQNE